MEWGKPRQCARIHSQPRRLRDAYLTERTHVGWGFKMKQLAADLLYLFVLKILTRRTLKYNAAENERAPPNTFAVLCEGQRWKLSM